MGLLDKIESKIGGGSRTDNTVPQDVSQTGNTSSTDGIHEQGRPDGTIGDGSKGQSTAAPVTQQSGVGQSGLASTNKPGSGISGANTAEVYGTTVTHGHEHQHHHTAQSGGHLHGQGTTDSSYEGSTQAQHPALRPVVQDQGVGQTTDHGHKHGHQHHAGQDTVSETGSRGSAVGTAAAGAARGDNINNHEKHHHNGHHNDHHAGTNTAAGADAAGGHHDHHSHRQSQKVGLTPNAENPAAIPTAGGEKVGSGVVSDEDGYGQGTTGLGAHSATTTRDTTGTVSGQHTTGRPAANASY